MKKNDFNAFSLQQIAAWGLDDIWENTGKNCYASLPPIQRGFVWKAEQVETLWDSIAQGFPIGSLLLERWENNTQKGRPFEGTNNRKSQPTWQLLDGQQRATSIIKGFQDIWSDSNKDKCKAVSTLWVDLAPKGMEKTDRRFLFRLVTKSHPWGYRKINPSQRLSALEAYKSLVEFRKLCEKGEKKKPHEFSLREVFPWDAEAPVPLALLLKAIKNTKSDNVVNVAKSLRNLLKESLPIWETWSNMSDDKRLNVTSFSNVEEELSEPGEHFKSLVFMLRNALDNFCIPAPELKLKKSYSDESVKDEHHPTFNLFKRVNSGGTVLSNEEIQYSLLKTIWPNAPSIIEGEILKGRQLCQPARMVSLLARLFLMLEGKTPEGKESKAEGLQAALNIAQFNTMLNSDEKVDKFEKFCEIKGKALVAQVWLFLTPNNYGLPKVLAARIASSHADLLLMLMLWQAKVGQSQLTDQQHRRSLGFVTALAWFAAEEGRCVQLLAKKLRSDEYITNFADFFNSDQFACLLEKDDRDRVLMVKLRTPDAVEKAFRMHIEEALTNLEDTAWKKKEFWELYPIANKSESNDWYPTTREELQFLYEIYNDAHWCKLLYAQRAWVEYEYGWFDPTQPEMILDRNRPWDYDHILPQSWSGDGRGTYAEVPQMVRTWIWSIGNFRAWPLEHNRSKGAKTMIEDNLFDYGLENKGKVLKASFIHGDCRTKWDVLCERLENNLQESNKPNFWKAKNEWPVFVEAALLRSVEIYREWYDELLVGSLNR